jgi:IS4 transposase
MDLGATTIAAIYKDRWQIEIFFKYLKQNLKIKTFVGTSTNAVKIQIWSALASISTVLEMTNGTADLGEADDKLLVAEPRHGCWSVGKF